MQSSGLILKRGINDGMLFTYELVFVRFCSTMTEASRPEQRRITRLIAIGLASVLKK